MHVHVHVHTCTYHHTIMVTSAPPCTAGNISTGVIIGCVLIICVVVVVVVAALVITYNRMKSRRKGKLAMKNPANGNAHEHVHVGEQQHNSHIHCVSELRQ